MKALCAAHTERGGAAVCDIPLQVGKSRFRFPVISLEIVIDIMLSVPLWPWGSTHRLTKMSIRNISWDIQAAGAKD